jgi:hypothetical protein
LEARPSAGRAQSRGRCGAAASRARHASGGGCAPLVAGDRPDGAARRLGAGG